MFKLTSLNVRGLNNFKKRRIIFCWCRKMKSDMIFLQETHSTQEVERQWEREWGGKMLFSHGANNARGVIILVRNGFDYNVDTVKIDSQGRFLLVKGKIQDVEYTVVNIYAPNKDACSRKFFENLQQVLSEFGITNEDNVIIGGDFNCPLNPLLDKKGGILIPRANVIRAIETLKENFSLQDIWRVKNPDLKSVTWSQKSPFVFCRLDYWLTSFHLFDNVKNVDIVPAIKTDHSAITIEFESIDQQLKGSGSWKLNVSLLLKKDYIEEMEFNIPIWRNESISFFQDQQMSWEWIKYRIREFSINFSKRIARESKRE